MSDQPNRVHPLFPLREGEERDDYPQIGWIHVTRYEAGGQVWAPRLFTNAELTDQSDITQMFGGGRYELVARDPEKTSIVRREAYNLAGPARPLSVDTGAGTPPPPTPHHAPAPSGAGDGMVSVVLAMMQQNSAQQIAAQQASTQMFTAMMQAQGQQQAATTQMIVAALSSNKQDPAAFIEAAAKLASANGGGNGGGAFAAFKDGMQTAFGIAEAAAPEEKSDLQDLTEGLQAAAQVMNAAKAGGGQPS